MARDGEFAGRTVVVTGAGRGIGRGIAKAFAGAGAQVMIGARTLTYAQDACAEIAAAGGTADVFGIDVKQRGACEALIAHTADRFGGIDIVIHCAAEIPHGGLGAVSDAAMDAGFDSIAKAAWWLLQAARPWLAASAQGGRFITIGSVNGVSTTVPNMTAYGMAKAALDAFVRGAALDVVNDGITVNDILPGLIASDNAKDKLGEAGLAAYGATMPVGRAGTPEDIAHACFFLASSKAGYVTGSSVRVDGGSSLSTGGGRDNLLQDFLKPHMGA